MQTITPDFLMSQLRLALVAVLAYGGGAHWFTPEAAGLYLTLFTTLGPIVIPWAWSIFSNLGKVSIGSGSAAAAVAAVEKIDPVSASTGAAKAIQAAKVASVLILAIVLSLLAFPQGASAQVRRPLAVTGDPIKDIKTDLNNAGIKVPTTKAGATCDFNIFAALNPQNVVTDVQNCVSDVNKLFLPDVQAALDSATAYSDKPAIDCLTPALAIVKAAVGTPAVIAPDGTITTPAVQAGIILIFQKFREFTLANGPSACKNWVQSTINGTVSNAL